MLSLMFMLHVTGCLWYAASQLNPNDYTNWVTVNEMKDDNMFKKYAISIYWATVTCTTVGYGDITPLTAPSQSLTLVLNIIGQFYLAIVIGVFVGKYINVKSN